MMEFLRVEGISKKTGNVQVLKSISFHMERYLNFAIAGETGSGKSTLLKIIGGLIQPDEGKVFFEGSAVKGPDEKLIPGHSSIAYLSQHFELRNSYRVEEILNYANLLSNNEADHIYELCYISHLLKRKTNQISGGERQRIALARLLVSSPQLLLLDEPFSNLDVQHKNILQKVIRDVSEELNITCILISHDPGDILSWADEIMILKDGHAIQQGTPEIIYNHPVNEYTAGLFGSYNLLSEGFNGSGIQSDGGKKGIIRPERVMLEKKSNGSLKGLVQKIIFFGSYYEIKVELNNNIITARMPDTEFIEGDEVFIKFDNEYLHPV